MAIVGGSYAAPGVGTTLNYIGGPNGHAFSNSGAVACDNNETTLIEARSGADYIVGEVQFNIGADTADDYFFRVYQNNILVNGYLTIGASQGTDSNNPMIVLIPPNTLVKMTAVNTSDSSSNNIFAVLVGRVYGEV